MKITPFGKAHIPQAERLAKLAYEEERASVPDLPALSAFPSLEEFTENGLSVSLLEGDRLLGFLCPYPARDNFFGLCKGVYVPIHGHGAVEENRAALYDRLYQGAAERWVAEGILTHCIGLYHHDAVTVSSFFQNGFGGRCVDAIRRVSPIGGAIAGNLDIRVIGSGDASLYQPLANAIHDHFRRSPIFMPLGAVSLEQAKAELAEEGSLFLGVYEDGAITSYLKLLPEGENFMTAYPCVYNITGAYTLPARRGGGAYPALMAKAMEWMEARGYTHCGVDYESFNPTARLFWEKHFTPYTASLVRRIDERIIAD